jgi:hypothetical protein
MARRRPVIPPAQRPPARSVYKIAFDMPRRGIPGSLAWPDTGVLIGLGISQELLARFRRHYRARIRVTKRVASELRGHSLVATESLADEAHDRVMAARAAVQALLIGPDALQPVEATMEDLPEIERITQQLKAKSDDKAKGHGGEAEIIALAAKEARRNSKVHLLLTNDGGASIIAHEHGLPSRHIGDMLAEFACDDPQLAPEACRQAFEKALRLSAPPAHSRQSGAADFTCRKNSSGCDHCDKLATKD